MAEPWFQRELLTLPDGRTLELYLSGATDGTVLVIHDGSPSAGIPFRHSAELARDRGLRLVSSSRAGYAASSRNPGRDVAAVVPDVVAVLDHLGTERCYTMGWSGGGPHALATAALLGDRVIAASVMGGVAPYAAEGLDWMDGMGAENVEEFGAALAGPAQLQSFLERAGSWLANVTADEVAGAFGDLVSEVDRASITGEYAEWLASMFRASISTGIWGWFDDDAAFVRPWGFEIGSITRPVAIWQGAQDRMVPFAHGQWLASHVGGARAHLLPEHGHLSLEVALMGGILDDLMASGREAGL
ncbi:MAG: alpha/beta hydrolase [Chloroflexota bacterium]|nr:alpha/beta hydrolase [Chloroflexota bacterium]